MKFHSAFALEEMSVYDIVKFKKLPEGGIGVQKCTRGKPDGYSAYNVVEIDKTQYGYIGPVIGSKISVVQQGIIPHNSLLNYRLGDPIYFKNGKITTQKSKYKIGVVIPQGIYLDFLK